MTPTTTLTAPNSLCLQLSTQMTALRSVQTYRNYLAATTKPSFLLPHGLGMNLQTFSYSLPSYCHLRRYGNETGQLYERNYKRGLNRIPRFCWGWLHVRKHASMCVYFIFRVTWVRGYSQILSCSHGERSEGLGSNGLEMVDSVRTNWVHVTYKSSRPFPVRVIVLHSFDPSDLLW